jgi:hypothetical protein
MKVFIVIQGPIINENIYNNIKNIINSNNQLITCISTYKDNSINLEQNYDNINIIKNQIPTFPNTDLLNKIKTVDGEKVIGYQIYSTYNGLKFLKEKYNPNDDDIVIKCRSDEYYNIDKFINQITNIENLYTIDYVYVHNSISDHIFACKFSQMYLSFKKMYDILFDIEKDVLNYFYPPNCIEQTIYSFLKQFTFNKNQDKIIINVNNLSPCHFKMNHQNQQLLIK